jgi:hypothetical protein
MRVLDYFDADVSGRDFAHGKPDPERFPRGGARARRPARAGGRYGGRDGRRAGGQGRPDGCDRHRPQGRRLAAGPAGADIVVKTPDEVDVDALVDGRLAIAVAPDKLRRSPTLAPCSAGGSARPVTPPA